MIGIYLKSCVDSVSFYLFLLEHMYLIELGLISGIRNLLFFVTKDDGRNANPL